MSKVSDNLKAGIKSASQREWNDFFDSLRDEETAKIPDAPRDQLVEHQASLKAIRSLRKAFLQIHDTK